jgi:CubicO group peptidase (beta-lactamase class C family)
MKRILPLLALPALLLAPCLASAQSLSAAETAQVDQIFAQWNRTDSPGCALGVYKDGQIVYTHGYGMANLNDDVAITPETVFHVASMSKQFTAFSILLLAAQGKLSLDDDIHKYIPELQDFGVPVTLRQMMNHTSGLRDQWSLLNLAGWRYSQDLITDDDVLSVVTRQKALNFKPGDQYMYSNTGFTLLAQVVKRVSGMSFREFTSKNIFIPLGMTHTHFRDDHEEVIKHDALGYEQPGPGKPFRMSLTNFDTAGATSLHTTVEDLALWDENFYHPRVGSPAIIAQMVEPGKLNSGKLQDYASGLSIGTYRGLHTVGHGGADAGYRSNIVRFPDQHFGASVLCNFADTDPGDLANQVADVLLARDFKETKKAPAHDPAKSEADLPTSPEQMTSIAGGYWDGKEQFANIAIKDGKLMLEVNQADFHQLKQFLPSHFHVADESWGSLIDLHFIPADQAKPRRIEETFDGGNLQTFTVVDLAPIAGAQLNEYTGPYVSEEIDPVYRIAIQNGSLVLTRLKYPADTLHLASKDVFVGDTGKITFTRDASQHINGFLLDADRIQNLKFTKRVQ